MRVKVRVKVLLCASHAKARRWMRECLVRVRVRVRLRVRFRARALVPPGSKGHTYCCGIS